MSRAVRLICLCAAFLLFVEVLLWTFFRPIDQDFPSGLFVNHESVGYKGSPKWRGEVARIHPHHVELNSEGYRDDDRILNSNQQSILMLGSTALFGLGVEKNDRLSERLASLLGIKVDNAAMYGYGAPQALWALSEFCKLRNYSTVYFIHEYKLSRNDFVINPARIVQNGFLLTLPVNETVVVKRSNIFWILERFQLHSLRSFLASHEITPRQVYENLRGLETFGEDYFLKRYAVTVNEKDFPLKNIKKLADSLRDMNKIAPERGAKFVIVLLPGPFENRFRRDEPSTMKLKQELGQTIRILDLRHVLPADAKLRLTGLDYFNQNTLDAFAKEIVNQSIFLQQNK